MSYTWHRIINLITVHSPSDTGTLSISWITNPTSPAHTLISFGRYTGQQNSVSRPRLICTAYLEARMVKTTRAYPTSYHSKPIRPTLTERWTPFGILPRNSQGIFTTGLLPVSAYLSDMFPSLTTECCSAIELMNEPRISNANFTMSELKAYYSAASQIVRESSTGSLRVLIHDAFWGPGYWSGFDPLNNVISNSPEWLDIDLHNYFAFAPNNNLPQDEILEKICNTSQYLRNTQSLSPVLVGEWSLETGTAPNASPLGRAAQSQARRTWFRKLFEAQLAGYSAYGWYFWTWKTECESWRSRLSAQRLINVVNLDDINTWSYRRGIQDGWIPPNVGNTSQLVFPLLPNGCIDTSFGYTAPGSPEPQFGGGNSIHQFAKNRIVAWLALILTAITCIEIG